MNETPEGPRGPVLTRVCPTCSVQSQTTGDFCPHCGKSYVAKPLLSRKAAWILVATVAVAGVVGGGVALKVSYDRDQDRKEAAAQQRADDEAAAAAAQEKKKAAEAAAREDEEAAQAAIRAEQKRRQQIIRKMQASITKDARQRVRDGDLDGPIFYTNCDPLGGGSVDDLTALTTTFECLAVHEKLDGGQVRGWVFSSTANWDEGSWSWRLGS